MARPIVLSNGSLNVSLDAHGLVHDFYYPHIGQENHTAPTSLHHKIGVFVDDEFYWLDDPSWVIRLDYYGDVLVSRIVAINETLQVRLEFDDCVDSDLTAFMRNIHIINMAVSRREIRLFMHQGFLISDSNASDTVQYLPEDHALLHFKGHRVFMVGGAHADTTPFDSFTVDQFTEDSGAYLDALDGELKQNVVAHGSVDSVLAFHATIRANSSRRVHYWIAAGRSEREAKKIHESIKHHGLLHHVLKTANWWAEWLGPTKKVAATLPEKYRKSFMRSALILRAAIDKQGAVIASPDTSARSFDRDTYAYCWPRDAVFALWPLLRIGYTDELLKFFAFTRRSLHDDGYLAHKYQADGAVGASWHGYQSDSGQPALPIQTDETASVLFLFGQYYRAHSELQLLGSFYSTLIEPMANYLSSAVDDDGLPLPSYDIWQEKYLTSTYTTAATYASLGEAAYLAGIMGDLESAARWQSAADRMYTAREAFYNAERSYFYKGFTGSGSSRVYDDCIDSSSLFGVFLFGYFDQTDKKITESYETLCDNLMTIGGKVIRYENDSYKKLASDPHNPWPITSLWAAQYALQAGETVKATTILDWVVASMETSGALAEQYDHDDRGLSVSPFSWSQGEYLSTLLDLASDSEATT